MRIIVKSIGNMPGKASIPLGCVLDKDGPTVVAYGEGGTFSAKGLRIVATNMSRYVAYFADDVDNEPVNVQALDLQAALMWLRNDSEGEFSLYVIPASTHLGIFNVSEEGQSCDSRCRAYPATPCPIHQDEEGQS